MLRKKKKIKKKKKREKKKSESFGIEEGNWREKRLATLHKRIVHVDYDGIAISFVATASDIPRRLLDTVGNFDAAIAGRVRGSLHEFRRCNLHLSVARRTRTRLNGRTWTKTWRDESSRRENVFYKTVNCKKDNVDTHEKSEHTHTTRDTRLSHVNDIHTQHVHVNTYRTSKNTF
ncbi:hypothetical protein PUN28_011072 [Cardiocondyla obscurior]|uniref:Uncharacterized protein n=1 Tax=Cardiocondyla obscurior TaxID=286306 RepID=A0AAW2FNI4_9HYME